MIHIKTLHELFPTEEDKEAFLHCLTTKTFWAFKVGNFLDESHGWLKDHPQAYALVEEDASSQTDTANDRTKLAESTGLDLFMLNDLYFRSLLAKHTELKSKTDELIKSLVACTTVNALDELGCKTFPGEWASSVTSSQGKTRTLKAEGDKVTYIKGTDSGTGVKIPCFTRPIAYPELFVDRTDEELKCHALDLTDYVYYFATDHFKDKYSDKNLYGVIENYLLNNTLPENEKTCKTLKGVEYYFFVQSVLSCITPTKDRINSGQYTLDLDGRFARLFRKHFEDVAFNLFEHSSIGWNAGTKSRIVFEGDCSSVLSSRYKADDYAEPALSKVVVENVIKPVLHDEHIKSCLFSRAQLWGIDPVTICLEAPSKTRVSEDATKYDEFMGRLFSPGHAVIEKSVTRVKANPGVVAALAKLPTGGSKRKSLDKFYKQLAWFNDYLSQDIDKDINKDTDKETDESFKELFNGGISEQEVLDGTAHFVIFLLDNAVIDLGVFLRENIKPTLLLHHCQLVPEPNETGGMNYVIDRSDYHYSSDSAYYFIVDNEEQKTQADELVRGAIDNTCAFTKGSLELKYEIIIADQDVDRFPELSSVVQNSVPKTPAVSVKDEFSKDCFERDLLKEQVLYYKLILNCLESSDVSYLRSAKHFTENTDYEQKITEVLLDDFDNAEERDTAKKGLIEFANSDLYDSALFVRAECCNGNNPGLIIRRPGLITYQYLPRLCDDGRLRYEKVDEGVYFVPILNSSYFGGSYYRGRYSSERRNICTYLPVYVKNGMAEWLYPGEIPDFIPVVRDMCNEIDAMSTELLMAYAFETSVVVSGEKGGYFGEVTDDAI